LYAINCTTQYYDVVFIISPPTPIMTILHCIIIILYSCRRDLLMSEQIYRYTYYNLNIYYILIITVMIINDNINHQETFGVLWMKYCLLVSKRPTWSNPDLYLYNIIIGKSICHNPFLIRKLPRSKASLSSGRCTFIPSIFLLFPVT